MATAKLMREDKEEEEEEGKGIEEDRRKGSSSIGNLAPVQAPALQWAMPMVLCFWATGPSIQVARRGLPASSKSRGKAPAIEVALLSPEIDEELVWWL